MSYEQDQIALRQKYETSRVWFQATSGYGWYVYPRSYYKELVDLVLKHNR